MGRQFAAVDPERETAPATRRFAEARTSRRRLFADRAATWMVKAGGFLIIASILGILVFIVAEVAPLGDGATIETGRSVAIDAERPLALVADEYRTFAVALDREGTVRVVDLASGASLRAEPMHPDIEDGVARIVAGGAIPAGSTFQAATDDGRVWVRPVGWEVDFVEGVRNVDATLGDPVSFDVSTDDSAVGPFSVGWRDDGSATVVARLEGGRLAVVRRAVRENFMTGEIDESFERFEADAPFVVDHLLIDADQRNLYGASAAGQLAWWTLEGDGLSDPHVVDAGDAEVSTLGFLLGHRSLLVGHADGAVSVWFPARNDAGDLRLTRIRTFEALSQPIVSLVPSLRRKGFVALDASGAMALMHSTSERVLWTGASPVRDPSAVFYTPKTDAILTAGSGRIAELEVDNPHPEVSWKALFGKVWYEGYEAPAHVWQSTGGSDQFEPKLSMTPLMIGTLKGTFYSLLLAIPLGVLGAMYTSQFMHHSLRRYVKPVVEIMAALPSVVLGFLAGLWLAPRLENALGPLFLMLLVVPLFVVVAGRIWAALPSTFRGRLPGGFEAVVQIVVVGVAMALSLRLGGFFERAVFGGPMSDWLIESLGIPFDQRNAIVVGLAMGFAVIPIIFSIAEDAFSNVPRNLVSGSLALGANRWQTVTRVVLPTASPGIFSAVMIGFGRAVGETMIVLMATGNTPIMDWNPFNGFRTLSANIAVEIPEAPQGGTLYRALFLAALILFVFTFVTNTVAEVVRQRLRRRYAEL